MIRLFDIILSLLGLIALSPIFIAITLLGYFYNQRPFFIQNRMGMNMKPFKLIKFRSMKLNTASVATHLVNTNSVTPFGKLLRKSKLDELPQLLNVLLGDMSLVGPRPNLLNQDELIKERKSRNVYKNRPGITGLAQINKIDMSTPKLLAETDEIMILSYNIINYFKYIYYTLRGKGFGDTIK